MGKLQVPLLRSGRDGNSVVGTTKFVPTTAIISFGSTKPIKTSFRSATSLPGSTALPFVISWMLFPGNVFDRAEGVSFLEPPFP
jgi:hypothetical protein